MRNLGVILLTLATWAVMVSHITAQAAGPAKPKPPVSEVDELRPVYATAADVAEGKRVTDGTCSRCHGANGISNQKGVPHLAGQRPAYLYTKLRAYQAGTRGDHGMEAAVKFLNDDALVKVSAYYASLEPAQPRMPERAKGPLTNTDPLAAGKAAAASCGGCHGETGVSKMAGTPSLAGLDPKSFVAAMTAYKSGQRKHDVMKSLASAVSEADIKSMSFHYALQKPARAPTPAPGDQAAGKSAAAACAGCHGEQGVSASPGNPSLAGQDAQYFIAALKAYKDGTRKDETMKGVVGSLSDGAMRDLAAYYAAQEPKPPKVDKPLTLAEWVQRCDRCHGVNGNSTDPRSPALAGQRQEYLMKAIRAYQNGARKDSVMAAMSSGLTDADIDTLAGYYSRQKARAFVYVTLPGK